MSMGSNGQSQATEDKTAKTNENVVVQDKSRRKALVFAAIGIVLVLLAAIIAGVIVLGGSDRKLQKQLDLGAKYLEEMDYEQALVAFNAALEIEPKNVDAYLGIVEVYIRTNEFETALEYAREGYEVIGDERLKEKIDTLDGAIDAQKLQEQLDLGAKYLEEMNYDQTLAAFHAALEMESKNADAYLGIVEVYIRTSEFDTALEYAGEGFEVTGDERLKEKIDMIESGDIFASNGWRMKMTGYDGDGNLVFWHEYTYNLQGRKASVAMYNAQGVQEQYLELAYDEEGRTLISYSYGTQGGDITKKVYEYNGNNYRVTSYEGTSDEVRSYSEVETDADGKILKETIYDEDGNAQDTEVYKYNEDGQVVRREYYDSDNELTGYYIHTYDEDGKRLQQQHYDGNGMLTGYSEDVYDAEGKLTAIRSYDADGVLVSERIMQ